MDITVIGLGLIGGSFCKAITEKTDHKCYGIDINKNVLISAINCGAIIGEAENLGHADLTIISLYPDDTITFLNENCDKFKKGSIVIDTCGVKKAITKSVFDTLKENDVTFIGAHPMAGKEFSGFAFAEASLFEGASLILTPNENISEEKISIVRNLGYELSFSKVVITTDEEHDRIIAYTSQLAHIVSSAYIKSPTAQNQSGFSAGSFKDLTRVALLNEDMWTTLFMMNKENLINEIDTIVSHLEEYRNSLKNDDNEKLKQLLKDGRILKKKSMEL